MESNNVKEEWKYRRQEILNETIMKEAWKFTIEKLKKEYKGADITCDNPLTITRKDLLLENNK